MALDVLRRPVVDDIEIKGRRRSAVQDSGSAADHEKLDACAHQGLDQSFEIRLPRKWSLLALYGRSNQPSIRPVGVVREIQLLTKVDEQCYNLDTHDIHSNRPRFVTSGDLTTLE